jgi:transcriptional regulator with XRE-family HTH domain
MHMATKYTWTPFDHAAQQAAAKIISRSGYSYRSISDRMHNVVSHVRISDIEKGNKAPIKISEFLLICQACGADPLATLRWIIARADEIEAAESVSPAGERLPVVGVDEGPTTDSQAGDDLIDRIAAHSEDYDVAANRDPNKTLEAETPRD